MKWWHIYIYIKINVINEEDSEDCKSSFSCKKSKQNLLKKYHGAQSKYYR